MGITRIGALFTWLLIWLGTGLVPAAAEPEVGQTLNASNWQAAKEMMPDAILKRFETGEHVSKIIAVPPEGLKWGSRFLQLTEANAGKYAVDGQDVMIETATGTWPHYMDGGFPFPEVNPADPQAAYKVMYNMALVVDRSMI